MSSVIAEAFVRLRPIADTFRAEAQTQTNASLTGMAVGGQKAETGFLGANRGALRLAGGIVGITTAAQLGGVAIREIVGGAAELEQELDVLNVTSGATVEQMESIRQAALDLGRDITLPGVTAGDAARGMNELVKAGLSVEDTLGGIRGTLQLAAAAEIDVADSAGIVAGALNAFGLAGTEAVHVADLLAGASIAAQGNITEMAQALQQSSAVANQAGLSIEQLSGLIVVLNRAGLRGSDVGTSIRTALLRIIAPNKEAAKVIEQLGIQYDQTRTLGEQLPEVIGSIQDALERLTPGAGAKALNEIFGQDAIRFAAILGRVGPEGLLAAEKAANRLGAANDIAAAKNEGLRGSFDALGSTASTTATRLGEFVNPGIQQVVDGIAIAIGSVDEFIDRLEELNSTDINIGPGDIEDDSDDWGRLEGPKNFVAGLLGLGGEAEEAVSNIRDAVTVTDVAGEQALMRAAGFKVGQAFTEGVKTAGQIAIDEARATLARVVQAGRESVRAAIVGAQQALVGLGSSLAADAVTVIDQGPIIQRIEEVTAEASRASAAASQQRQREAVAEAQEALDEALRDAPIERRIRALQEQLDRENRRSDRQDVARSLRDAQEELAEAQKAAQFAGPVSAEENLARRRFLRPFMEEVQDAKAEVRRFNVEGTIEGLQKKLDGQTDDITENINELRESLNDARQALIDSQQSFATEGLITSLRSAAEAQKRAVTQGINDSIDAFNRGQITLPELNRRLATTLEKNGVNYRNAGAVLGTAFVNGFEEKMRLIREQAGEIVQGPFIPGATPAPVSPAGAAADAEAARRSAQRSLDQAILEENEKQTLALAELVAQGKRAGRGTTPSAAEAAKPRGG